MPGYARAAETFIEQRWQPGDAVYFDVFVSTNRERASGETVKTVQVDVVAEPIFSGRIVKEPTAP